MRLFLLLCTAIAVGVAEAVQHNDLMLRDKLETTGLQQNASPSQCRARCGSSAASSVSEGSASQAADNIGGNRGESDEGNETKYLYGQYHSKHLCNGKPPTLPS
jgi:hypothetical protein